MAATRTPATSQLLCNTLSRAAILRHISVTPTQRFSTEKQRAPETGEFPLFPFKTFRVIPEFLQNTPYIHDPWHKREAWRDHPFFSRFNRIKQILPGFGYATIAFSIYLSWDYYYMTEGAGAAEKAKRDIWMEERKQRLGENNEHSH